MIFENCGRLFKVSAGGGGEMYTGWSLKRQPAWDAAKRLRPDHVNICRLHAKWLQMGTFWWSAIRRVEAEREEAKASLSPL